MGFQDSPKSNLRNDLFLFILGRLESSQLEDPLDGVPGAYGHLGRLEVGQGDPSGVPFLLLLRDQVDLLALLILARLLLSEDKRVGKELVHDLTPLFQKEGVEIQVELSAVSLERNLGNSVKRGKEMACLKLDYLDINMMVGLEQEESPRHAGH